MKLMVIDGNSIVNRAFYGVRPLTTRDGLYTHAVYGFLTTLLHLREEEQPDGLCVTFDVHAPTFRHKADAAYKATRKGMPEELLVQMPVLKEVLDDLNIPRYEMAGWEADDLIGTISRKCEAADWDCVIVTGDKDSLQLVTDHTKVKLVSTRMGRTTTVDYTPETFQEKYGFPPKGLIDLKALMGDSSDNIPGVKGIGEKTAMKLIGEYGSIDHIYEDLDAVELKPAQRKKMEAGEADARQSYWLATIVTDAPFDFNPADNPIQAPKPDLYDLFLRLEFTKLIERFHLKKEGSSVTEKTHVQYETTAVTEPNQVPDLLNEWKAAELVTVLALPDLAGVGVCWDAKIVTVRADELGDAYGELLRTLFSNKVKKVSHGVKDFMRFLLAEGLSTDGFVFDTELAAYLLDATAGHYDLPRLSAAYLRMELPDAKMFMAPDAFSLLGDSSNALNAFTQYVGAVEQLREQLMPQLKEENLTNLLMEIELPLCPVLAEMEQTGCLVDGKALEAFRTLLTARIAELETEIYEMADGAFNINSPKQLGEVLFDRLGLPPAKKTKTGYSTSAAVLEKLRVAHPIVDMVLEYRQLAKLKSTYADGLLKAIASDGRIHTNFQMTVTATGRLSSTEPNLQNIPARTDLGSEIRRMFVPAEGNVLVDADYSQIELRVLSHMAGDTNMQHAFTGGEDIHTETASQVFHLPPEEITHELRRRAKAVNFGIVYGISPFSLAKDIGSTMAEAKSYMENYFAAFPGVRQYMDDVVKTAKDTGFVETLYHRRRALPELSSSKHMMRAFGERVALNMPIQGTAADIMKLAMIAVYRRLKEEHLSARIVLQVHDELIVECPQSEAEQVKEILTEEMEGAVQLAVPLTAEAHIGTNWLEAKG